MIAKIFASILLQIALPFPGPGTPHTSGPAAAFVQATSCQATAATSCTTPAITVTSGHTIAFCWEVNANSSLSSITISTGTNTLASFTQLFTPVSSSNITIDCRYILSTDATGSTTFTATGTVTNNKTFIVFELSVPTGVDGTVPAPNGVFTAGQTVINCPSYTTTHSNALVICAGVTSSTISSSWTASSGFTIPSGGSVVSAGGSNGAMEYQAGVASGTPLSPTVTPASGTMSGTFGAIFAFN